MKFNEQHYSNVKKDVVNLIKQTHDWQDAEGFLSDGLISPKTYEHQELKVLVMLGESYGYDECEVTDIELQPEKDILGVGYHRRQTAKKIPALLWLIFEAFQKGKPLVYDDFPDFFLTNKENFDMLQSTLSKIAWVNVKKSSRHIEKWGNGATNQNDEEIYRNCIRNKDLLKLQIDSICPDLIITCGNAVFNGLADAGLLGGNILKGKKNEVQINNLGQRIIQFTHPSHFGSWGYRSIFKKYEIIYHSVKKTI